MRITMIVVMKVYDICFFCTKIIRFDFKTNKQATTTTNKQKQHLISPVSVARSTELHILTHRYCETTCTREREMDVIIAVAIITDPYQLWK